MELLGVDVVCLYPDGIINEEIAVTLHLVCLNSSRLSLIGVLLGAILGAPKANNGIVRTIHDSVPLIDILARTGLMLSNLRNLLYRWATLAIIVLAILVNI